MKYFIFLTLFLFSLSAFSQVSIEYVNVVTSSTNYTYVGINYQPNSNWMTQSDWNRIQNVMSARQAMYERGHGFCSNEYRKVMNLVLINQSNKDRLITFQKEVKKWAEKNYSNIDLSIESNVNSVINYFTQVYKYQDIRNEIRLLNELNSFYQYINNADPYQVNKGKLYEDFNSVMQELKFYNSSQLNLSLKEILDELRQRKYNAFKNDIYSRFYSMPKTSKVTNGWHLAYYLSKEAGYGQRSVFVSNGKVQIFKRYNGKEESIISGGTIVNQYCKSAIYNYMDSYGVFKNIEIELFFMD
jgi:hypothetical protein